MAKKKTKAKKKDVKINAGLRCLNAIKRLRMECRYQRLPYMETLADEIYLKFTSVLTQIDNDTFKNSKPKKRIQ